MNRGQGARVLKQVVACCALLATSVGAISHAVGAADLAVVTDVQTIVAPDAGATNFGGPFGPVFPGARPVMAMDEDRIVVPAMLAGRRVVYAFDRAADMSWSHSATISAPPTATASWGDSVGVAGDTIVVADAGVLNGDEIDQNFGRVHVYDLVGPVWTEADPMTIDGRFELFAAEIWTAGDSLLVRDTINCDGVCSTGRWHLFERDSGMPFVEVFSRRDVDRMSVGIDGDRVAVAIPGSGNLFDCFPIADSNLAVIDVATDPSALLLDERVPDVGGVACGDLADWFQTVDISGDVLAFEACCTDRRELHIRRDSGAGYVAEQVVAIPALSDGLALVPDAILRADFAAGVLLTLVFDAEWTPGPDLALPTGTQAKSPVIAAANRVAVVGDQAVHVLTVEVASPLLCFGLQVTIDIGAGDIPTSGDDVILGTGGADTIVAGAGNDVVCGGDGNDVIAGGSGTDLLLGGAGVDVVHGGADGDIVAGGAGTDVVLGGADGDLVIGQDGIGLLIGGPGNDLVVGGGDDDTIFGGLGDDALFGGGGVDFCDGGAGTDTAVCENTAGVP